MSLEDIKLVLEAFHQEMLSHAIADDDGMALPKWPFDRDRGRKLSPLALGDLPDGSHIYT